MMREQQLVERLRELQSSFPDVKAAAVVSLDGVGIASTLPRDLEEDRMSAMSVAMLSLGERIADELGRGALEEVWIKGEQGFVVQISMGKEAVLTAVVGDQARLGLVLLALRRASEHLYQLLQDR